jgi:hypothetical protein
MHVDSKKEIGVQSYEGCCLALRSMGRWFGDKGAVTAPAIDSGSKVTQ